MGTLKYSLSNIIYTFITKNENSIFYAHSITKHCECIVQSQSDSIDFCDIQLKTPNYGSISFCVHFFLRLQLHSHKLHGTELKSFYRGGIDWDYSYSWNKFENENRHSFALAFWHAKLNSLATFNPLCVEIVWKLLLKSFSLISSIIKILS